MKEYTEGVKPHKYSGDWMFQGYYPDECQVLPACHLSNLRIKFNYNHNEKD